jgi:hypothetical protein
LNNAKASLRHQQQQQDGEEENGPRDVVATFRERARINSMPTFSNSNSGKIRMNQQRRRELEHQVLGHTNDPDQPPSQPPSQTPSQTAVPAAVPATALVPGRRQLPPASTMETLGDVGAYSNGAAREQQQQQQVL